MNIEQSNRGTLLKCAANSLATRFRIPSPPRVEVIREGTHLVVRIPKLSYVGRIMATCHDAESVNTVARWNVMLRHLADAGAPILAPLNITPLPVGDSHIMTLWSAGTPTSEVRLGVLLKGLHPQKIPQGYVSLVPQWNVSATSRKVTGRLELVRDAIPTPPLRNVLCHGDAHVGNTVLHDDEVVFVDLDNLTLAPCEFDLAPSVVATRRFPNLAHTPNRTVEDYGMDNVDENLLNWFVELRELTMLSWLATLCVRNLNTRGELEHRMETWKSGGAWNPI